MVSFRQCVDGRAGRNGCLRQICRKVAKLSDGRSAQCLGRFGLLECDPTVAFNFAVDSLQIQQTVTLLLSPKLSPTRCRCRLARRACLSGEDRSYREPMRQAQDRGSQGAMIGVAMGAGNGVLREKLAAALDVLPLRAAPLQPRRLFCRGGCAQLHDAGVAGAARRDCPRHSVGVPQFRGGAAGTAGARLPQFRAANQRAGELVVPVFRRVGDPGHRDRHRRHRRDRRPPADHGRGPAERAVAGDDAAALGSADRRVLDADDARAAAWSG